jgi:NAD(P)-dependent dehydrogenase (short-subunit alcohol dehydrogenase family)
MDKTKYLNRINGHALVLGGSGGLGSEIVRALAASGASALTFTYGRNKAAADKLVDELKASGLRAYAGPVDQSNEAAFKQFLADAAAAQGEEICVAVNSIGISPNIPLEQQTLDGKDGWRNVFGSTSTAAFSRPGARRADESYCARLHRPHHLDQRHQLAIADFNPLRRKSGTGSHDEDTRRALRAVIRINAVAPSWIETSMTPPADESSRDEQDLGGTLADRTDCRIRRLRLRERRLLRLRSELHGRRRLPIATAARQS